MDFYDRDTETLGRGQLRDLQNARLRAMIQELDGNQFYQQKLRRAGINGSLVHQFEDLAQLPFTTKAELVEEQSQYPPFGRLLSYPLAQYRYFHQTSGTKGQPLKWLDTGQSWEWWERCWNYVYRGAGVDENDIVFCAFSFGPYISHWAAMSGAWRTGAMCLSGGGMNSEQRLACLLENNCTVLACTPTYALHLAEVARSKGIELARSAIRITIHAGEPGASLPNVKRRIEEEWGATCFDHAGATEVGAWGFDCQAQTGAIHLNEAEFIFEVVDPKTALAIGEGERGELVVTNLGRTGMPVIRYRTGDLVELVQNPCSCGRSFVRIKGGVLGRTDDMLIVRGVNLYPGPIDDLLRSIRGIVEYEVNIRQVDGMDDLLIRIETDGRPADHVQQSVMNAFRQQFNIRVSVEQVETGMLPRYEFKARRFRRIN